MAQSARIAKKPKIEQSKKVNPNRYSQAVKIGGGFGNNRISENNVSENSQTNNVRFGTQIAKAEPLQTVNEDQESENFEFNPYRLSDNADDLAIENFLYGNPNMFAKEPPKKEKKLDSSEKVKNSGFTSTRWHE